MELKSNLWRTKFHIMPPAGWLNDPNGLCYYKGLYHTFFQYCSDSETGSGQKVWGHYVSKDFINWEFKGTSLLPDKEFDKDGVYSGSALIDDGKMYLYYTGNVKQPGDFDYIYKGREGNTIAVESEDGFTFSPKRLLLTNNDYPKDISCHVRDPKVWSEMENEKKTYFMVLGARSNDDVGLVLLYQSYDKENWVLKNRISSKEKFGFMWECPDVLKFEDKDNKDDNTTLLSISPQGVEQEGRNYQNIYQSGYYFVEGDLTDKYNLKNFKEWDRGFDFYAPQTFVDNKGRRILIGWMGIPDEPTHLNPTVELGWQHILTLPREVKIEMKNGKKIVTQNPIEELKSLRKNEKQLFINTNSDKMESYEIEILNHNEDAMISVCDGGLLIGYNKEKKEFYIEFSNGENGIGKGRHKRNVDIEEVNKIHVIVDVSAVEVFVNDGEEAFATRMYTEDGSSYCKYSGENATGTIWEL